MKIRKEFGNLWTAPEEHFIKEINSAKGIGSVANITETSDINEIIRKLMEKLSLHLTNNCKFGYRYIPQLSGSVSEGTKVGFPEEFDYLIFIEGLDDQVTPYQNEATEKGFVMLKFKEDSINEELSTDRYFDAIKFHQYFDKIFLNASSVFAVKEFYYVSCKSSFGAATTLLLSYPTLGFGDIDISVDIAPVIKLPVGWRPLHFRESFVFHRNDRLCATLMKHFVPDSTCLRISMSLIET